MTRAPPKNELVRAIGRWTLTALVLNCIVGAGIFGLPGAAAKWLGPAAPLAYLVAAAVMSVFVAVFAEVGSQFRETGGQYLYARAALGRLAAIQVGWFFWLTRVTTAAAVTNLFVTYLGEFFPGIVAPRPRALVMTALIGGLAAINYRGVRAGAGLANFFTVAKLVPLGAFIVIGLWLAPHIAPAALAAPPTGRDWTDALLALIYAFAGFEAALIPAAEAKDPRRDTPFALHIGLGVVAAGYLLVHLVAMWSVPDLAHSTRPLADAARVFAGPGGAAAIAAGALLSTLGWLSASFVTSSRLTFAFAERGDFPRGLAAVHPRFRTPHISILLWAVLVLALAISGSFLWNAILSVVARLVTYGATCLALIQLRRRQPHADRWRAPAGNFLAVLGLALCVFLVSRMTGSHAQVMAAIAVGAIAHWLAVRQRPGTGS